MRQWQWQRQRRWQREWEFDDASGTHWRVTEHGGTRRLIAKIRRLPLTVQILIAIALFEWGAIVATSTWLLCGALFPT